MRASPMATHDCAGIREPSIVADCYGRSDRLCVSLNRETDPVFWLVAFSSREPVSASLENALLRRLIEVERVLDRSQIVAAGGCDPPDARGRARDESIAEDVLRTVRRKRSAQPKIPTVSRRHKDGDVSGNRRNGSLAVFRRRQNLQNCDLPTRRHTDTTGSPVVVEAPPILKHPSE